MINLRCLTAVITLLLVTRGTAGAVDTLNIDFQRDSKYLPFEVTVDWQENYRSERKPIMLPFQVLRAADGAKPLQVMSAYNPSLNEDIPAQLTFYNQPGRLCWSDNPIDLTVTDFTAVFSDSLHSIILAGGYRHDSAFALELRPDTRPYRFCFLATGPDRTGNGVWEGFVRFVASGDFDTDGSQEAIFCIHPSRDLYPRQLTCIDIASMTVKWNLMIPNIVVREFFSVVNDSSGSIIFCSAGSGHAVSYPPYHDLYCYVSKIDRHGQLEFARIASVMGQGVGLVSDRTGRRFYVAHTLPFLDPADTAGTINPTPTLSLIDADGHVLRSAPILTPSESIWLADYTGDGRDEVFTLCRNGVIMMFSAELELLGQTTETDFRGKTNGMLPPLEGRDSVMAFITAEGGALYDTKLHKLAVIPAGGGSVSVAGRTADGRLSSFVNAGMNEFCLATVTPRTLLDNLATFYFDYRYLILAALSSALLALVVSNVYRRKVSAKNKQLATANEALAKAHEALKEAQATILSQEKYRQAKDIAGGFAHEIRNALLPAEIAVDLLRDATAVRPHDDDKLLRYIHSADGAVRKALELTELISRYTKLDSQYAPEEVCLRKVLDDCVEQQSARIIQGGIKVSIDGHPDTRAISNTIQLGMVVTNLLVNAIDALEGRPDPTITIAYSMDADSVRLTFADNGAGIAPEVLPRIFDTFFSTKPSRGTGLGLATTRRVIDLYGGTIAVESTLGVGTCFVLCLKTT